MVKIEKKLQNIYLTDYNLLAVQNLWQAHYQIPKLGIKYKEYFLEYTSVKDNGMECKCLYRQKKLDEKLKKPFLITYKFSNHVISKFTSFLGKGV